MTDRIYCTGQNATCPDDEYVRAPTVINEDFTNNVTDDTLSTNFTSSLLTNITSLDDNITSSTNMMSSRVVSILGTVCRESVSPCDPVEYCDGLHVDCPLDIDECGRCKYRAEEEGEREEGTIERGRAYLFIGPIIHEISPVSTAGMALHTRTRTHTCIHANTHKQTQTHTNKLITGGRITIEGANFGNNATDINVIIGNNTKCSDVIIELDDTVVSCNLPFGAGNNLAVHMSVGGLAAVANSSLSYTRMYRIVTNHIIRNYITHKHTYTTTRANTYNNSDSNGEHHSSSPFQLLYFCKLD